MKRTNLTRSRLASAVAAGIVLVVVPPGVSAYDFQLKDGELTGRLDTTLSVGALWRTEGQDRELAANEDPILMAQRGYSTQLNKNDANNNFDTGLASLVYKITPELSLNWNDNWGALIRGTAWYDSVIMGGDHDGGALDPVSPPISAFGVNRYASYSDHANNGIGDDFTEEAEDEAGSRARLLDAYLWGNFQLGDMPLNARAGKQVISWGEALFIQNGVNSANYIDLAALRLPGAEIKEALLPQDALYFSLGLTQNLTLESFAQFEWNSSEDAPVGTYFSTHDAFPGEGANHVVVDGRLLAAATANPGLADLFAIYTNVEHGASGVDWPYEQTQVTVDRIGDQDPSDSGQFGVAFRYFADALNGTEFGLFYTQTHAKIPMVAARLGQNGYMSPLNAADCTAVAAAASGGAFTSCTGAAVASDVLFAAQNGNASAQQIVAAGNTAGIIDTTGYSMAYAEDVDMFGLSFSTLLGPVSVAGEIAYRPDFKIINEVGDTLISNLALAAGMAGQGAAVPISVVTPHCVHLSLDDDSCYQGSISSGMPVYFYEEVDMFNGSLVSIFNFGPALGTDSLVGILEVGVDHVAALDETAADGSRLYYNSTAAVRQDEADTQGMGTDHYLDRTAWGYRAVLRSDFNDVFAGVSMQPSITLAHDVNGNSPIGGNFMENRKAATLGVNFLYMNNLDVGIQATSFWGAGYSNKLTDRNNASLVVKYSF